MTYATLTPTQQRKAVELLQREDRKAIAREKLYTELKAKRNAWFKSSK